MSPVLGLHENVAELDFESMYPSLIVRYNISYENTGPDGVKNGSRLGFLPELTREFLERRLYFKQLRRSLPKESLEYLWCDQRQKA
ncbi:MAG: DNA polymerase domain-containing protein, partial [Candidatus Bathyarchaeia archaeon]